MTTARPDLNRAPGGLFDLARVDPTSVPLAERMRPRTLAEFAGQGHLVGPGRALTRLIAQDRVPSLILWGPPGTGKTTLARLLAAHSQHEFETLSATSAGIKEIRAAVEAAQQRARAQGRRTVLFVDEIHRFHKGQQDALLPHVEDGTCALIGATTENPSFEVNAALLSRARVLQLRPLDAGAIATILRRALEDRERGLGAREIAADEPLLLGIGRACAGDARRALGALELAVDLLEPDVHTLTTDVVAQALGQPHVRHDKGGDEHYNVVSALIKSMRASDPDAAVYWLTRLIEAGETLEFIARRIVIFAAEDVGNAEPQALVVAMAAAEAARFVGFPEAALPLTQAAVFLALAPKSNVAIAAYFAARKDVRRTGALPVPLVIRNAVTALMRESGHGVGYRYPHDFRDGVAPESPSLLPEGLAGARYVRPTDRGWEGRAAAQLAARRAAASGAAPRSTAVASAAASAASASVPPDAAAPAAEAAQLGFARHTRAMGPRLSVNVNKVATVRNARGADVPSVVRAVQACLAAGAPGITVHPRADARHITAADVRAIAQVLVPHRGRVEFNIEGDPRPDLLELVHEVRPDQLTLVPVRPGELTSEAGWPADTAIASLQQIVADARSAAIRVSVFVAADPQAVEWAAQLGADRVELYTEPFARAFAAGPEAARASFERYAEAARVAHRCGLGVNAGHDLDLDNLTLFRELPHLDEVSIGHALIAEALFRGLDATVRAYLAVLAEGAAASGD